MAVLLKRKTIFKEDIAYLLKTNNIKKVLGNPDNSIDHGISQKSVKNSIWRRQALLKLKNLPPNKI